LEGKANPLVAAPAFAKAAREHGAELLLRTEVVGIERKSGGWHVTTTRGAFDFDRIVDVSGAEAGRLAEFVGVPLPVCGQPIQAAVTEPVPPLVRHLLYFAGGRLTLKQARIGSLLIGGGWPAAVEPGSGRVRVAIEALGANVRQAVDVVPGCAGASLLRAWTGVCPALPDHRPILGEVADGMVVGMFPFLGFTCAPIVARIVAALVLGEEPRYDLRPFDPLRLVPSPQQRGRPSPPVAA
jgi:glycine/D-amino acid oxidase-like deaminating enzyme